MRSELAKGEPGSLALVQVSREHTDAWDPAFKRPSIPVHALSMEQQVSRQHKIVTKILTESVAGIHTRAAAISVESLEVVSDASDTLKRSAVTWLLRDRGWVAAQQEAGLRAGEGHEEDEARDERLREMKMGWSLFQFVEEGEEYSVWVRDPAYQGPVVFSEQEPGSMIDSILRDCRKVATKGTSVCALARARVFNG